MSATVYVEESTTLPYCCIEYPFKHYQTINVLVENEHKGIDKVELLVFDTIPDQFSNNCLPASVIQGVLGVYYRLSNMHGSLEASEFASRLKYRLEIFNTPQKVRLATYCLMKFAKLQLPDGETIIEIDKSVMKRLIDAYFLSDNEEEALIEYSREIAHIAPNQPIQGFMDMYQAAIMCYYLFDCTLNLYTLNANYQEHDKCSQKFLLQRPVHDLLGNAVEFWDKRTVLLHGSSTMPGSSMNHFTFLLTETTKIFVPHQENNILISGISISFYLKNEDSSSTLLILSGLVTGVFRDYITIVTTGNIIMQIGQYDYNKWIVKSTSLCPEFGNNYTLFDLIHSESSIPPYRYNAFRPSTPIYITKNQVSVYTKDLQLYQSFHEKIGSEQYKKLSITYTGHLILAAGDIIDFRLINNNNNNNDKMDTNGYYIQKCDNRKHILYLTKIVSNANRIRPFLVNDRCFYWKQLVVEKDTEILAISLSDIKSIRMSFEHFLHPLQLARTYNTFIPSDDILLVPGECPLGAYNIIMKDRLCTDVIRFVEESYIPILMKRNNNQFYYNRYIQYEPSIRSAESYPIRAWLISLHNKRQVIERASVLLPKKNRKRKGFVVAEFFNPSLPIIPAIIPAVIPNSNSDNSSSEDEELLPSASYFDENIAEIMKNIIATM